MAFEELNDFVNSSNMDGEYAAAIRRKLTTLHQDYETLKYNIDHSLLPTAKEFARLKESLQELKKKNSEYQSLQDELTNLMNSKPIETITVWENGKQIERTNPTYNIWITSVAEKEK